MYRVQGDMSKCIKFSKIKLIFKLNFDSALKFALMRLCFIIPLRIRKLFFC